MLRSRYRLSAGRYAEVLETPGHSLLLDFK